MKSKLIVSIAVIGAVIFLCLDAEAMLPRIEKSHCETVHYGYIEGGVVRTGTLTTCYYRIVYEWNPVPTYTDYTVTADDLLTDNVMNDVDEEENGQTDCWKDVAGDYTITSPYLDPSRTNHRGVDIGAPYGTPILSPGSGTVAQLDRSSNATSGNGAFVRVNMDNGTQHVFLHMQNNSIPSTLTVGSSVVAGQLLGLVDHTGGVMSSNGGDGDHLHWHIYTDPAHTGTLDPIATTGDEGCSAKVSYYFDKFEGI